MPLCHVSVHCLLENKLLIVTFEGCPLIRIFGFVEQICTYLRIRWGKQKIYEWKFSTSERDFPLQLLKNFENWRILGNFSRYVQEELVESSYLTSEEAIYDLLIKITVTHSIMAGAYPKKNVVTYL